MKEETPKKKSPVLIIIIIILIILGGGYYFFSQKGTTNLGIPLMEKDTSAFLSIKDALTKSISMECVYTDEMGVKITTYIKNSAIRTDSLGGEGVDPGSTIIKDNKMYSWSDETREGFIIEMVDTNTDETIEGRPTNQGVLKAFVDDLEAYRNNCKVTTVSDSNFVPPTDIEFKDIASMFSGGVNPTDPEGLEN